jgi:hypothetical protein
MDESPKRPAEAKPSANAIFSQLSAAKKAKQFTTRGLCPNVVVCTHDECDNCTQYAHHVVETIVPAAATHTTTDQDVYNILKEAYPQFAGELDSLDSENKRLNNRVSDLEGELSSLTERLRVEREDAKNLHHRHERVYDDLDAVRKDKDEAVRHYRTLRDHIARRYPSAILLPDPYEPIGSTYGVGGNAGLAQNKTHTSAKRTREDEPGSSTSTTRTPQGARAKKARVELVGSPTIADVAMDVDPRKPVAYDDLYEEPATTKRPVQGRIPVVRSMDINELSSDEDDEYRSLMAEDPAKTRLAWDPKSFDPPQNPAAYACNLEDQYMWILDAKWDDQRLKRLNNVAWSRITQLAKVPENQRVPLELHLHAARWRYRTLQQERGKNRDTFQLPPDMEMAYIPERVRNILFEWHLNPSQMPAGVRERDGRRISMSDSDIAAFLRRIRPEDRDSKVRIAFANTMNDAFKFMDVYDVGIDWDKVPKRDIKWISPLPNKSYPWGDDHTSPQVLSWVVKTIGLSKAHCQEIRAYIIRNTDGTTHNSWSKKKDPSFQKHLLNRVQPVNPSQELAKRLGPPIPDASSSSQPQVIDLTRGRQDEDEEMDELEGDQDEIVHPRLPERTPTPTPLRRRSRSHSFKIDSAWDPSK